MQITLIVARSPDGVIGRDNALPWHLPEDLRHFKSTTMGHAIVMGRLTFDSIGRALPGRRTIVVTRRPDWRSEGCERAESLPDALALAARRGPDPSISTDEVFVVGGASIYREALPLADRLLITEVGLRVDGNIYFPAIDPARWREVSRVEHVSARGIPYAIVDLRRDAGSMPVTAHAN